MPLHPPDGAGLAGVEVPFDDGKTVILRKDELFVQVRRGPMSMEGIELLTAMWRSARRTDAAELGGLFVLEADAPVAAPDVRVRQRDLLREMMRDGRLKGVLVIEGSGVQAMAMRSVARLLSLGWRLEIVSTVDEAVAALEPLLGRARADMLAEMARDAKRRLDSAG